MRNRADDAMWETIQGAHCDVDAGAGTAPPAGVADTKAPYIGCRSAVVTYLNQRSIQHPWAKLALRWVIIFLANMVRAAACLAKW